MEVLFDTNKTNPAGLKYLAGFHTLYTIKYLEKNGEFLGDAKFTDYVYGPINTDKDLPWVRKVIRSSWAEMKKGKYYPFFKQNIKWFGSFQFFKMPVGDPLIECRRLEEARLTLGKHLVLQFSFSRETKEYKVGDILIYVEEVEHIPTTVEVLCKTEKNSLKKNMESVNQFMREHSLKGISHQVATLVGATLKK